MVPALPADWAHQTRNAEPNDDCKCCKDAVAISTCAFPTPLVLTSFLKMFYARTESTGGWSGKECKGRKGSALSAAHTNASTGDATGATWNTTGVSATCTPTCAVTQSGQSEWDVPLWMDVDSLNRPAGNDREMHSSARRSLHGLCTLGLEPKLSMLNLIYRTVAWVFDCWQPGFGAGLGPTGRVRLEDKGLFRNQRSHSDSYAGATRFRPQPQSE